MNKKKIYIMIGISGSGKSTAAFDIQKELECNKEKAIIISSDEIRKELYNDEKNQQHNDEVFKFFHNKIKEGIHNNDNIICDATNLSIKKRKIYFLDFIEEKKKFCDENKRNDYEVIAYVMNEEYKNCIINNNNRERVVDELVINKQILSFEMPFIEEGFDKIIIHNFSINKKFTLEECIKNIESEMKGFDQKTKYHKYDLGTHCKKVTEYIKEKMSNEKLYKYIDIVARIHDYGKLFTGKIKDDGDYGYFSHENYGAYKILTMMKYLNDSNISYDDILKIIFYVNMHMRPFDFKLEKTYEKYLKIFGEDIMHNLIVFNECDKMGAGIV